jgi:hypothetical protein
VVVAVFVVVVELVELVAVGLVLAALALIAAVATEVEDINGNDDDKDDDDKDDEVVPRTDGGGASRQMEPADADERAEVVDDDSQGIQSPKRRSSPVASCGDGRAANTAAWRAAAAAALEEDASEVRREKEPGPAASLTAARGSGRGEEPRAETLRGRFRVPSRSTFLEMTPAASRLARTKRWR